MKPPRPNAPVPPSDSAAFAPAEPVPFQSFASLLFAAPLYQPQRYEQAQMATALAGLLARDSQEGLCPDCAEHSLFSLHQSDLPEAVALLGKRGHPYQITLTCVRSRKHRSQIYLLFYEDAFGPQVQKVGQWPAPLGAWAGPRTDPA
ncbi:hypothetical protein [Thalassovita sp.]|uniref:hypothetical protein n=1 Tax=Thalassovita sp. TaxID=1979401 RepID=UPI002AB275A8|nr:hypothetical protein [Thalassovita sp.]